MDLQNRVIELSQQVEAINQTLGMMQINLQQTDAKVDQNQTDTALLLSKLYKVIPVIGNTTTQLFESDTITSLDVTPILFNLKNNDKIVVYDLFLENTFEFTVDENASVGDISISISSTVLDYDLTANSLVLFKVVRDSDHKLEIEH
jgi:hypothetical protein